MAQDGTGQDGTKTGLCQPCLLVIEKEIQKKKTKEKEKKLIEKTKNAREEKGKTKERKKERKKSSRVKAVNNGWSKKVSSFLQAARDSRVFAQGVYFHGESKSIEITHLLLCFLLYMRNNHYGPKCAKKL